MPKLDGFVNGTYVTASAASAGEVCMNLVPEQVNQGGKTKSALVPVHGPTDFAMLAESPGRGIFAHKERCFTVFGRKLYELASDGTPTELGDVVADENPVTFDTNGDGGNELFVTSGDKGYVLDLTTNMLTTPLASGSTQGGQLDGFFVSLNANTSTFRLSDALDGTTWSGIQVAQRTSASDPWQAMVIARGEIFLFGNKTGEVWTNVGAPVFPFAERPEGAFECGIAAKFSATKFAGSIAWLGRTDRGNPSAYMMDGYSPLNISTPGMDWLFQQHEDQYGIDDAIGWGYDRDYHKFYVLHFPRAGTTYAYDATTQKWHQRGFWDKADARYTQYRPVFSASCFGKNLVCDSNGYKVYALSSSVFTDVGGSELRRERRTPHTSSENKRIIFHSAELECDRGVGNVVAPAENPQVGLSVSNNGGVTYGTSRMRGVGRLGEASTRVRWEPCGAARDRMWKVWSSDPAPTRWFDFYFTATVCRN